LLLLGLGVAVVLVGGLIQPPSWGLAAAIVAVVVLGVFLPGRLRDSGRVLDAQRAGNAGENELAARERCLHDMGRPDLVDTLAFAREQLPEDARFLLKVHDGSLACFTLNLLPRQPVRRRDFDPNRHWLVLDRAPPKELRSVPAGAIAHSPSFVIVPPGAGVSG
jgi:hypothetical protein